MTKINFSAANQSPIQSPTGANADQAGFNAIFDQVQSERPSLSRSASSPSSSSSIGLNSESSLIGRVFGDIYRQIDGGLNQIQPQPNLPAGLPSVSGAQAKQPSTQDMLQLQHGITPGQNDQAWQLEDNRRKKATVMDPLAQAIVESGRKVDIESYLGLLRNQSSLSNSHLMTLANLRHMADNPDFADKPLINEFLQQVEGEDGAPVTAQSYLRNRLRQLFPDIQFHSQR